MRRLAGLCVALAAVAAAAGEIPFSMEVVDAANSGDDKALADIDGDGLADGVIGGGIAGLALVWYRSEGAARDFTRFVIRESPVYQEFTTDMATGDVDGDGDVDLVLGDGNGTDNVLWFENPRLDPPPGADPDPTVGANWTFHAIGTHGSWAHDVFAADLDGDGRLDVVTGGNGHLHVFLQDAGGGWVDRDLTSLASSGGAPAAIDGDGLLDLFVGGGWLEAPPDPRADPWTFHAIAGSDPGDGPAVLGVDLNGDGRSDLVSAPQHGPGLMRWFENPPDPVNGTWVARTIDPSQGSHHLVVADFDGDQRPDLLTGLEFTEIAIYLHQGGSPPTFAKQVVFADSGHNAVAADVDGNGLPDVWACDFIGNPPVRILWNDGALFADGFESGDTGAWSQVVP